MSDAFFLAWVSCSTSVYVAFSGRMMRDHMILDRSIRRHRNDFASHQFVLALVGPALNDFLCHHRAYSLQVLKSVSEAEFRSSTLWVAVCAGAAATGSS